jgi:2-polyprenyl-3-methyl-5-hydroxy-6-metoxy-1,4-benzoquinol methylase
VPGDVALLRCAGCAGAVTDGPVPREDLHEAGAYGGGAPRGSRAAAPLLRAFDRARLRRLGAAPGARVLDVGAGRGRFVATARAAGLDAHGLEPSARGLAAAGPHVAPGGVDDVAGTWDAITLWHVLEHLDDPAGALTRLAGHLRPGGVLLVGVPNLDSVQARVGGPRWFHLDVPRHRTHFTARGARLALERAGLQVVAEHHVGLEHNPFGMWQSAVNRLTRRPSYLFHLLKRNAPLRSGDLAVTLLCLPLAPVAAAAELVAGLARRGGTVALRARAPGA